jgi:3-oxoacyl-[acyl-carrier protein] reductase
VTSAAKRALVTGAAAGLGRVLAVELAKRGVSVAMADIDAKGMAETEKLISAAGVNHFSIAVDLGDPAAVATVIARVIQAWGGLDILINNAGYGGIEPFFEMTAA